MGIEGVLNILASTDVMVHKLFRLAVRSGDEGFGSSNSLAARLSRYQWSSPQLRHLATTPSYVHVRN